MNSRLRTRIGLLATVSVLGLAGGVLSLAAAAPAGTATSRPIPAQFTEANAASSAVAQQRAVNAGLPAAAARAPKARTDTVPDVEYSCSGIIFTASRQCYLQTENGHAPLFAPNGNLYDLLPLNDKVLVTCFYLGNPPSAYLTDGIEDHVVWENTVGYFTGHIPDAYINEGGNAPWNAPYDISQCG
jgi:hypothetical protein